MGCSGRKRDRIRSERASRIWARTAGGRGWDASGEEARVACTESQWAEFQSLAARRVPLSSPCSPVLGASCNCRIRSVSSLTDCNGPDALPLRPLVSKGGLQAHWCAMCAVVIIPGDLMQDHVHHVLDCPQRSAIQTPRTRTDVSKCVRNPRRPVIYVYTPETADV